MPNTTHPVEAQLSCQFQNLNIFDKTENIATQKFTYKSGKANLNLIKYTELLGEVKQKLNDYKLVLTNKLNQAK